MLGKNRIREIRFSQNITVTDLEIKAELGHSTISRIENYKSSPTLDTMIRISRALEMNVWDVFYDE